MRPPTGAPIFTCQLPREKCFRFPVVGATGRRNFSDGVGRLAERVVMKKDANVRDRERLMEE